MEHNVKLIEEERLIANAHQNTLESIVSTGILATLESPRVKMEARV